MARVIGIMSGKGGVGKTTTALNLGLAIRSFGEKVTVIDGDIKNPNLGLYLGVYQPNFTLNDVIKRNVDLNEAKFMHASGIEIVPASLAPSNIGLSRLRDFFDASDGYYIIDFPPGLGKDTLAILDICDEGIIVTNPNMPSVVSTMRLINIIKSQNKKVLGVIINMLGRSYEIGPDIIDTVCSSPVVGQIPEDDNVRKSAMEKTPVLAYKPYTKASLEFKAIAARITGNEYKKPQLAGLRGFFAR